METSPRGPFAPGRLGWYGGGVIFAGVSALANITIHAADGSGSFNALLVKPSTKPAGAVVVIQEIFGINDSMRATAEHIADLGFFAVVPDLFWRLEPGVELTDKSEAEFKRALALMQRFDQDLGIEDCKAALAAARTLPGANGKAGTMGYCLGGRLAFMMATRSDADVNISYYGVGLDGLLGELGAVQAPLVLHIAGNDGFFPAEGRARVIDAVQGNSLVQAFNYAGADHGFARAGGVHWDGLSATIANGRSAEALGAALK
jgi:carboxymethylenebutenolidase